MSANQRAVDVWILDSNTIYREVPFTVVTDWVQQGRLLAEDKVRSTGTEKWLVLGRVGAFQPYFPKPDSQRVEDVAEAMEPVEPVLPRTRARIDEEEDVDMIPLIDISLVLLIFFMMTMAVSTGVLSPIDTPEARYDLITLSDDMFWLGIDGKDNLGNVRSGPNEWPIPWYTAGKGKERFQLPGGKVRDVAEVVALLEKELQLSRGRARVRIRADQRLANEVVDDVIVEMQKMEARLNAGRSSPAARIALEFSQEVSEPKKK